MRLRDNYKAKNSTGGVPYRGVVPRTPQKTEQNVRLREQAEMAQRLYRGNPIYSGGYPSRVVSGPMSHGLQMFESGEIELRSPCGGSPTDCSVRSHLRMATGGTLEVTPWGQRPTLYTEDGRKLTKRDYKPLRRYCMPHQIDRDATNDCPTVMVDHDLSIAAPLLPGENGMFAYWPCEQSYPVTWSSWLVTIENEEVCRIMTAALRKVCKYANAINSVMRGQKLSDTELAAARKEADRVMVEWKTATHMLSYLVRSRDPKEIAKMIMDVWSSRQVVVLAAALSQEKLNVRQVVYTAGYAYPGKIKFSTASQLWQMLREQTSEQYETKFLYTKPPEYRNSWQLISPIESKW